MHRQRTCRHGVGAGPILSTALAHTTLIDYVQKSSRYPSRQLFQHRICDLNVFFSLSIVILRSILPVSLMSTLSSNQSCCLPPPVYNPPSPLVISVCKQSLNQFCPPAILAPAELTNLICMDALSSPDTKNKKKRLNPTMPHTPGPHTTPLNVGL